MNKQRQLAPTAPLKGVFPLDHDGECKPVMQAYLDCVRGQGKSAHALCHDLSKAYLACRMDRGLMERESLQDLGFDARNAATARKAFAKESADGSDSAGAPGAAVDPRTGRALRRRREIVAGVDAAARKKPGIGWGSNP
mmetsp:Transcript_99861/g.242852  ORF Transcript_99861/g.242852 Transcript_99861/m.242852 type:complete len:139 (-) Transcript_99861:60-476(-)